ncbi:MAG: LysR family transcriptional regulator [Pseudomonadota bacterium]|jgi:DNA-binding transcriptional LysR family regulator
MSEPLLELDLLRAFVAVADFRSFTRAAAMLNRTQSAISMQIKRLEERSGTILFHRTRALVDLTPAGEGLLGYARRILVLNGEAISKIRECRIEGVVRLGVMENYASWVIPPLLSSFVNSYPHINVEVDAGLTSSMQDRLGDSLDLLIALHPEGQGDGEFLRQEKPTWAASASYAVDDFQPLPVALYPQGCLFRKWGIDALDGVRRNWRLAFVSQNHAAVASIAAQGLAVTIMMEGYAPYYNLRPLSEKDGMPKLPVADIRLHRSLNLSQASALLADHLAASLRQPS